MNEAMNISITDLSSPPATATSSPIRAALLGSQGRLKPLEVDVPDSLSYVMAFNCSHVSKSPQKVSLSKSQSTLWAVIPRPPPVQQQIQEKPGVTV